MVLGSHSACEQLHDYTQSERRPEAPLIAKMDANELIVEEWARVCKGQFTMADVKFRVTGSRGGVNYSNIDILAYDPHEDRFLDYEVKWRATEWVDATPGEKVEALVKRMTCTERDDKIKVLIGESNFPKLRRVFVTPRRWLRSPAGRRLVAALAKANVEIKYFEDVVPELQNAVTGTGRYDSVVSQLVRIMGFFGSSS